MMFSDLPFWAYLFAYACGAIVMWFVSRAFWKAQEEFSIHEFSLWVAKIEGKKDEQNIAQIKETIRIVFSLMATRLTRENINWIINEYKVRPMTLGLDERVSDASKKESGKKAIKKGNTSKKS